MKERLGFAAVFTGILPYWLGAIFIIVSIFLLGCWGAGQRN